MQRIIQEFIFWNEFIGRVKASKLDDGGDHNGEEDGGSEGADRK